MEDNNKITNAGWEAMRRLLDEEMPQERRRRRGAWWWGTLLLLLVLAGWQYGRRANAPAPTEQHDRVEPVATSEPTAATPLAAQTNGVVEPAKKDINGVSQGPDVFQQKAKEPNEGRVAISPLHRRQTSATLRKKTTASFGESPQNQYDPSEKAGIDPSIRINKAVTSEQGEDTPVHDASGIKGISGRPAQDTVTVQYWENVADFASASPAKPVETVKKPEALMPLETLTALPYAGDFEVLALPQYAPSPVFPETRAQRPSGGSNWQLGIATNILTRRFQAMDGYSAGLTVDWRAGSRSLGLRTGLFYAQERWNSSSEISQQQYVPFPASDYFIRGLSGSYATSASLGTVPGLNAVYADSLAGKFVLMQLSSVRRLELPLNLFWQVTPRLRLYGGPSFAWLTKANGRTESAIVPIILGSNKNNQVNTAVVNGLVTAALPRFSTRLQVGVGWQVRPRIEINAGLQVPLPLMSTTTQQADLAQAEDNILLDSNGIRNTINADALNTVSKGNFPSVFTVGAVVFIR